MLLPECKINDCLSIIQLAKVPNIRYCRETKIYYCPKDLLIFCSIQMFHGNTFIHLVAKFFFATYIHVEETSQDSTHVDVDYYASSAFNTVKRQVMPSTALRVLL